MKEGDRRLLTAMQLFVISKSDTMWTESLLSKIKIISQ